MSEMTYKNAVAIGIEPRSYTFDALRSLPSGQYWGTLVALVWSDRNPALMALVRLDNGTCVRIYGHHKHSRPHLPPYLGFRSLKPMQPVLVTLRHGRRNRIQALITQRPVDDPTNAKTGHVNQTPGHGVFIKRMSARWRPKTEAAMRRLISTMSDNGKAVIEYDGLLIDHPDDYDGLASVWECYVEGPSAHGGLCNAAQPFLVRMPRECDAASFRKALFDVAAKAFSGHDCMVSVLTTRPRPYAWLTISWRGANNKPLRFNLSDLQALRETLASTLSVHGLAG